jgi:hypothetical protein
MSRSIGATNTANGEWVTAGPQPSKRSVQLLDIQGTNGGVGVLS